MKHRLLPAGKAASSWALNISASPEKILSRSFFKFWLSTEGKKSTPSWCRLLQPSGKAATSWGLKLSVSPKVVLSTFFLKIWLSNEGKNRRLLDVDCCSHQVKLLPAGRWKFQCHQKWLCLDLFKIWLNTLRKNSMPSWCRLLQPSAKAATSWVLNISVSPKVFF